MLPTTRTPVLSPAPFSASENSTNDKNTPASRDNAGGKGVDAREYLLARMVEGGEDFDTISQNSSTNPTQKADSVSERADCICLERVGDNGHCPVHGGTK